MVSVMNKLKQGENVITKQVGNNMFPLIKNNQLITVEPVNNIRPLLKNDIVYCKVKDRFYLYKILSIKQEDDKVKYLVGNNTGDIKNWINQNKIYGKVIKINN